MKLRYLFAATAALALSLPLMPAHADTLHGYIWDGIPPAPDNSGDKNGFTPLANGQAFGFALDPGNTPTKGTLYLAILTPDNETSFSSITVNGNIPGTATQAETKLLSGSTTALWNSGDLASFLKFTSASPPNKLTNSPTGVTAPWPTPAGFTGYDVDVAKLGSTTLSNLGGSSMKDTLSATLPADSIVLAFFVETTTTTKHGVPTTTTSTIDTANSAVLEVEPRAITTPAPAALPLFGTGMALLGFLGWRKKKGGRLNGAY